MADEKLVNNTKRNNLSVKRKKWNRIEWETIESAYISREGLPSYGILSKEFRIPPNTIAIYASEHKWVTKRKLHWEKVGIEIREQAGERVARMRAKNILMAEGAQAYLSELMKTRQLKGTIGDVDKIARLLELLYGQADSRPDNSSTYEALIKKLNEDRRKAYNESKEADHKIIDMPQLESGDEDDGKGTDNK